jgi:hypothetical protein
MRKRCSENREGLQEHLNDLQQVLLMARTARADLIASHKRVKAAAGFTHF